MREQRKSQALGDFTVLSNGSELMIEVPQAAQVVPGTKFRLSIQADGTLTYHPIDNNPWLNDDYADIDFRQELDDVGNYDIPTPKGKESLD